MKKLGFATKTNFCTYFAISNHRVTASLATKLKANEGIVSVFTLVKTLDLKVKAKKEMEGDVYGKSEALPESRSNPFVF
jgi:hypothetical protein